jgi:pilus assembly protein CpaC
MEGYSMSSLKLRGTVAAFALTLACVASITTPTFAANEKIRIPLGRAEVVTSMDEVKTVAIAEPKIADAAVGSAKTVVVNGKSVGTTTLIVYNEAGRYKVYDVDVFSPNADRQVVLHVRVAELNSTASREIGFDLFGQGRNNVKWLDGALQAGLFTTKVTNPSLPLSVGANTDGIIKYNRNDGNLALQAAWKALEQKGDIRTLANPTLVAKSGEKASFLAGGEFPVPIASGTSGVGALGATQTITIEWREFGVKLDFTPTVKEDGIINLRVAPEVSQLDFSNPLELSGFRIPLLITRKASTDVDVSPGEHLIIGGLKQNEKTKVVKQVPILGSIPLLGFFFRTTRTENNDKELLVVVSPELLEGSSATLPELPTDRPERK